MEGYDNSFNPYVYMNVNLKLLPVLIRDSPDSLLRVNELCIKYLQNKINGR